MTHAGCSACATSAAAAYRLAGVSLAAAALHGHRCCQAGAARLHPPCWRALGGIWGTPAALKRHCPAWLMNGPKTHRELLNCVQMNATMGPQGALLQMRQRYDGLPPGGGARGWSRWVTCLWTGPGRCRCAFRKPSIAVEQGSASVRPCIGRGGCHPSSAVSRAYGQPYPAQCKTLFQHSAFHSRPLQQARRESGAET